MTMAQMFMGPKFKDEIYSQSLQYCFVLSTDVENGKMIHYNDGLAQDCSYSSALAMELLQSCTKPSIYIQIFGSCFAIKNSPYDQNILTKKYSRFISSIYHGLTVRGNCYFHGMCTLILCKYWVIYVWFTSIICQVGLPTYVFVI